MELLSSVAAAPLEGQSETGELKTEGSQPKGEFDFLDQLLGLQFPSPNLPDQQNPMALSTGSGEAVLSELESTQQNLGKMMPLDAGGQEASGDPSQERVENMELDATFKSLEKMTSQTDLQTKDAANENLLQKLEWFTPVVSSSSSSQGTTTPVEATASASAPVEMVSGSLSDAFENIQLLAQRGGGRMKMALHPAHLGQMEIEVRTRGNEVSVEMVSQSDAAKSLIESQLGELRNAMDSQNLSLSKFQVQVGSEQNFSSWHESAHSEGREQPGGMYSPGASAPVSGGGGLEEVAIKAYESSANGRLDLKI